MKLPISDTKGPGHPEHDCWRSCNGARSPGLSFQRITQQLEGNAKRSLLAPADPIAALDRWNRYGRPAALHVVIQLKIHANLDGPGASTRKIELKDAETDMFG